MKNGNFIKKKVKNRVFQECHGELNKEEKNRLVELYNEKKMENGK